MGLPLFSTKRTAQERTAQDNLNQANDLINLSMNPNDPRYQAMVANQSQGLRAGFLQNLRDIIEGNRRQALMGRQQYFDPERRDENAFAGLNQATQNANIQANQNVLDSINSAVQRLQGQSQSYLGLAGLQNQRNQQQREAILGLINTGVKAAPLFMA